MQSIHSHSGYRRRLAEYSASEPAAQLSPGFGAKALISAGILILTIWSVSLFSGSSAHSDPSLPSLRMMDTTAYFESEPHNVPSAATQVNCSPMRFYHWQPDCPLTAARSPVATLNRDGQGNDQRSTRREAELNGYHACVYCAEIEYWRARRNAIDQTNQH